MECPDEAELGFTSVSAFFTAPRALESGADEVASKGLKDRQEEEGPTDAKRRRRKSNKTKDILERQTKLKKGLVTKPRSKRQATAKEVQAAASLHPIVESTDVAADTSKHFVSSTLTSVTPPTAEKVSLEIYTEPLSLVEAAKQRDDWTSIKNSTDNARDSASSPITKVAEDAPSLRSQPKLVLNDVLQNFSYAPTIPHALSLSPTRSSSGEAFTKKRRVEALETAAQPKRPEYMVEPPEDGVKSIKVKRVKKTRAPKEKAVKVVKQKEAKIPKEKMAEKGRPRKAKSPAKKARTITDLATAAFRAPVVLDEQPMTSAFFTPRSATAALDSPALDFVESATTDAAKKKPARRKPSAKALERAEKAAAKERKLAGDKLLSPESAAHRFGAQSVLFGTSSQLARPESPTFVRQLQHTLAESEIVAESGLQDKTEGHSAPRGRLATMRTGRGLWSASARDDDDSLLVIEQEQIRGTVRHSEDTPSVPIAAESDREDGFIDIDAIAHPALEGRDVSDITAEDIGMLQRATHEVSDVACATTGGEIDESFVDIDTIEAAVTGASCTAMSLPIDDTFVDIDTINAVPAKAATEWHSIDSPEKPQARPASPVIPIVPTPDRPALKPLTVNTHLPSFGQAFTATAAMLAKASPKRTKASTQDTTTTKPRGRPRKLPASEGALASSSSKRSRKTPASETALPPSSPRGSRAKSPSFKAACAASEVTTSTSRKCRKQASPTKNEDDKCWLHIDEIEDSEAETLSPSPPRLSRSPSATTTAIPSLELSAPSAPPTKSVPAVPPSQRYADKKRDWSPVFAVLFPQITKVVKGAEPTKDPSKPSWHEKMLMYDPIVLEDLTAWLNDQGLRYETPARGKRSEDGAMETKAIEPWMVQKWCEEKSVCCLWKGGLRGGR